MVKELLILVCDLQIVSTAGLEIYKQAIYEKLPSVLALVGDIHDYSNEQFAEDLDTLVRIINNLYDSGIYQVATIKQLPGEECIPYLEEVVKGEESKYYYVFDLLFNSDSKIIDKHVCIIAI